VCPASACGLRITEIVSVRSKGMHFPTVQNPVQSYLQVQGSSLVVPGRNFGEAQDKIQM